MDGKADSSPRDLMQPTLGILFIIGLMAATLWILRPFLTALLWATMIVITTWPLLLRLEKRCGGRRAVAVALLTVALLLLLIVPLVFAGGTLIGNLDTISAWVDSLKTATVPPPPQWVADVPLVGGKVFEQWQRLAAEGKDGLLARIMPYAGRLLQWVAGMLGGLGAMIVQFLLIVVIAAMLYSNGETAADGVLRFARRLGGDRATRAAVLAGGAIRGVAMGVLVTALLQTLVAGTGLALASVPATPLLASAILVLCLAQFGPSLIMVPAVIWKFHTGDTLWGSVLLVFTVVSVGMDNFVRPVLIRKGADLPLVLIVGGVLGGMVSAGIMGIFVGPVILAVSHTLLKEWIDQGAERDADGVAAPAP